ncbi:MAG: LPS assembly lipoprotein LptE [Crocinitomicaceae bacterium]
MRLIIFSLLLSILGLSGCSVYSFTGASLVSGEQTISIQQFYNNALLGPSNMSQVFTETMRDYFQQNTNLTLVEENGDLQFEGYISSYTVTPVAPNANQGDGLQVSATTRVSITVQATYINMRNDQFDFDRSFTFFQDFDSESSDLQSVEDQLVEEIFDQIILDMFNASVANL